MLDEDSLMYFHEIVGFVLGHIELTDQIIDVVNVSWSKWENLENMARRMGIYAKMYFIYTTTVQIQTFTRCV